MAAQKLDKPSTIYIAYFEGRPVAACFSPESAQRAGEREANALVDARGCVPRWPR